MIAYSKRKLQRITDKMRTVVCRYAMKVKIMKTKVMKIANPQVM